MTARRTRISEAPGPAPRASPQPARGRSAARWSGRSALAGRRQCRFAVLGRMPSGRGVRDRTSCRHECRQDVDLAGGRRPRERAARVAVSHDAGLTRLRVMSPRITAVTARIAPIWSGARERPRRDDQGDHRLDEGEHRRPVRGPGSCRARYPRGSRSVRAAAWSAAAPDRRSRRLSAASSSPG